MLRCQKHLFTLPASEHYLNCAYMSPLSRRVVAAGQAGLLRKANPGAIKAEHFFDESEEVRRLFARLINADRHHIALIPAASYGIATVARNTPAHKGQNVVVVHEQFPSNVYTWTRFARQQEVDLRTVRPPESFPRRAAWNDAILQAIDADTAAVALAPVHWTDGTLFDLERIGAHARHAGARLILDGTQTVGALPFDVTEIQPDALVCAAYKHLMGPYSIGAMYLGPAYLDGIPLEENWITRKESENFGGLVRYQDAYQPGAIRYDVGERSNFILLPMFIAALEQVLEWTPAGIQHYCEALTRDLLDEARALGFVLEEASGRSAHLFGIRVPEHLSLDRLRQTLQERKVHVSLRGNAIRVSPHVYNDAADIDALRAALRAALTTPKSHLIP